MSLPERASAAVESIAHYEPLTFTHHIDRVLAEAFPEFTPEQVKASDTAAHQAVKRAEPLSPSHTQTMWLHLFCENLRGYGQKEED